MPVTNSKSSVEVKISDSTPKHAKAEEFGHIAAKSVMVNGAGEFKSVMEPLEMAKKNGKDDQQQLVTPPDRSKLGKPPLKPERHYKTDKPGINKMKVFFTRRRFMNDLSLFFALAGLVLMIVLNELVWQKTIGLHSIESFAIKMAIVVVTILLIITVILHHYYDMQIRMLNKNIKDWRVNITFKNFYPLLLEICICAICPFPGTDTFTYETVRSDGTVLYTTGVPIDVLLSIPMFLRLYLLFRIFVLHSTVYNDMKTRSIGAMNNLHFDFGFILKWAMTYTPSPLLLAFVSIYFLSAAYILRLVERDQIVNPNNLASTGYAFASYGNSLWLIVITFLTVGYGDMVPNTSIGRGVCIITGFVGVSLSSLLVAVLSSKLTLSVAEKNVFNFMTSNVLQKQRKNEAARIVQMTWLIHRTRKNKGDKGSSTAMVKHQKRFLSAINRFRDCKRDLKELDSQNNDINPPPEPSTNGAQLTELLDEVKKLKDGQEAIGHQLLSLEGRFSADRRHSKSAATRGDPQLQVVISDLAADIQDVKKLLLTNTAGTPPFRPKRP